MATEIDSLIENVESQPKTKKDEIHKNLQIVFALVGIGTFILSGLVNYYTLKRIAK